jgi:hypothetical protein
MSCRQVRRELLEHFAFFDELGPRSGPHLAHLESCADCRQEVGIDRELVSYLSRALRERVEGGASSEASWELVRRRIADRPTRPWTVRVRQWGGVLSAVAAGILMLTTATAPESRLFPGNQSPFVASLARRAVPPVEEAGGWPPAQSNTDPAPQADPLLPGWPKGSHMADELAPRFDEPPITGRMR